MRLKADPSLTFTRESSTSRRLKAAHLNAYDPEELFGNLVMCLIISSLFYNLQPTTATFFQRGVLIFFSILINAFSSALEVCVPSIAQSCC